MHQHTTQFSDSAALMDTFPHVVIFPFPAHGHMIPMLDLALEFATAGFPITVLTNPPNLHFLAPLLRAAEMQALRIRSATFPIEPPSGCTEGNASKIPFHRFPAFIASFEQLSDPIEHWFRESAAQDFGQPACIISDFFLGWTQKIASKINIPRIVFYPSGAFGISVLNSLLKHMPDLGKLADDQMVPVPTIPLPVAFRKFQISPLIRSHVKDDPVFESLRNSMLLNTKSWGSLINTFEELEKESIEHLQKQTGRPVWAVGPLLPPEAFSKEPVGETSVVTRGKKPSAEISECLRWLDSHEERSVVYVCFGSQAAFSQEEIAVLASGLEESGECFVWAMGKMESEAGRTPPEGFEERVKGRGFLIKGWAAQVALLSHPAIGCFLSHCGWNSVLESVAMGVPLLTWPLTADQFSNDYLLVEHLKIGERIRPWERREVTEKERVRDVVRRMLSREGASEEAQRAGRLRDAARCAVSEGGSSRKRFLDFAEAISVLVSPPDS